MSSYPPSQPPGEWLPPQPAPQDGQPQQHYGPPPQQQFGQPPQQYGPAPQQYGQPQQQYGPPGQYSPEPPIDPSLAGPELVGRGLAASLLSIPLGIATSVLLWKLDLIASLTSFVQAAAALWLYAKAAKAPPRRGALPLIAVVVVGVVLSFLSLIVADHMSSYLRAHPGQWGPGLLFGLRHMFHPDVLSAYALNGGMFVLFAALGIFGVIRQLFGAGRS